MVVTIHQPVFLPWIGFFHKVWLSDTLIYLDNVQLEKHSFQYRNRILSNQGSQWVTLPIDRKGHLQKTIRDHLITDEQRFKKKFCSSLQMNYGKAPFFKLYFHEFRELLLHQMDGQMVKLNSRLNDWFFSKLNMKPEIVWASQLPGNGTSSELLCSLCESLDATHYIGGGRAQEYLDEDLFLSKSIEVIHHNYKIQEYDQGREQFEPYLCILDALFHLGPSTFEFLCQGNPDRKEILRSSQSSLP